MLGLSRTLEFITDDIMPVQRKEEEVWNSVQNFLHDIGIGSFNYGFLDTFERSIADAPLRLYSTMDPTWIDYYADRRLDLDDHIMCSYRNGDRSPIFSGPELEDYICDLSDRQRKRVFEPAAEAGLLSAVSIPIPTPFAPDIVSGICLVSDMKKRAFEAMWSESGASILLMVNALHDRMGRSHLRLSSGARLTRRERDCLQYSAHGLRVDAIAHKLSISHQTVTFHHGNARKKLKARTLPEAVARAIKFGQIEP